MPRCSVCGRGFPEDRLVCCSQCGRAYCGDCAAEEASMAALGICPDCEEARQDEDDIDEDL